MQGHKKIMSLSLSAALVVSMTLAGCQSTKSPASKSDSDSASGTDLPAYNLVMYTAHKPQPDSDAVHQQINDYLKKKINATIDIKDLGDDYYTKMPIIISSGQKFDLCFTANWAVPYSTYAAQGAFMNLTKSNLLSQYGKGILSALDENLIKGSSINGDLYAVPVNKEAAYQWVLFYNKDLADKYKLDMSGVESAKTALEKYQALTPLFKTIHESDPNVVVTSILGGSSNISALPYDTLTGSQSKLPGALRLDDPSDTKVINQYETQDFKDYYKLMREWYQAGYIIPDAATAGIDGKKTVFAMFPSYAPYNEIGTTLFNSSNWGVIPLQEPIIAGQAGTGAMTAISAKSGNPERAMMFLNLLYSDPVLLNLFDYGIEGKSYTKNSDGTVEYNTVSGESGPEATKRYRLNLWMQGNQYLSYLYKGQPADKWDKFKEFNSSAKVSKSLGFTYDPTNISTEISAITNVQQQYLPSLNTGSVDPEKYLPEYISALKSAGLDKVLAELQSQFDKYLSSSSK